MPETTTYVLIQGRKGSADRMVELRGSSARVGRGADCEVRLREALIADVQFMLRRRGDKWHVQPIGPPGRVWVDGQPLENQLALPLGTPVRIGSHLLTLRSPDLDAQTLGGFAAPIVIENASSPLFDSQEADSVSSFGFGSAATAVLSATAAKSAAATSRTASTSSKALIAMTAEAPASRSSISTGVPHPRMPGFGPTTAPAPTPTPSPSPAPSTPSSPGFSASASAKRAKLDRISERLSPSEWQARWKPVVESVRERTTPRTEADSKPEAKIEVQPTAEPAAPPLETALGSKPIAVPAPSIAHDVEPPTIRAAQPAPPPRTPMIPAIDRPSPPSFSRLGIADRLSPSPSPKPKSESMTPAIAPIAPVFEAPRVPKTATIQPPLRPALSSMEPPFGVRDRDRDRDSKPQAWRAGERPSPFKPAAPPPASAPPPVPIPIPPTLAPAPTSGVSTPRVAPSLPDAAPPPVPIPQPPPPVLAETALAPLALPEKPVSDQELSEPPSPIEGAPVSISIFETEPEAFAQATAESVDESVDENIAALSPAIEAQTAESSQTVIDPEPELELESPIVWIAPSEDATATEKTNADDSAPDAVSVALSDYPSAMSLIGEPQPLSIDLLSDDELPASPLLDREAEAWTQEPASENVEPASATLTDAIADVPRSEPEFKAEPEPEAEPELASASPRANPAAIAPPRAPAMTRAEPRTAWSDTVRRLATAAKPADPKPAFKTDFKPKPTPKPTATAPATASRTQASPPPPFSPDEATEDNASARLPDPDAPPVAIQPPLIATPSAAESEAAPAPPLKAAPSPLAGPPAQARTRETGSAHRAPARGRSVEAGVENDWRLPSAQAILEACRTPAPQAALPAPSKPSRRSSRRASVPTLTIRQAPHSFTMPMAGSAAIAAACVASAVGLVLWALSVSWAMDNRQAGLIANDLLRTGGPSNASQVHLTLQDAGSPRRTWWSGTANHLYLNAYALNRSGRGSVREVDELLGASRMASPAHGETRLAIASLKPSGTADLFRSLGQSRDPIALAWTGRKLLASGKPREALQSYREALFLASRKSPARVGPPLFDESPAVRRYRLPGELEIAAILEDMAKQPRWTYDEWRRALPRYSLAWLAAYKVLSEQTASTRSQRDQALEQAIVEAGEPPAEGCSRGVHLAAAAEAEAIGARWEEAEALYLQAVKRISDDAVRRSWWMNLADIYARLREEDKRLRALTQARGANLKDDIAKRAAQAQIQSGAKPRPSTIADPSPGTTPGSGSGSAANDGSNPSVSARGTAAGSSSVENGGARP